MSSAVETNAAGTGFNVVTVPILPEGDTFFRLVLASQTVPTTETVAVTVIDANGTAVSASVPVPVQAQPQSPPDEPPNLPTYGTESPYDLADFLTDRLSWTMAMQNSGGTANFLWTQYNSWPGDFIEPQPAGQQELNPYQSADTVTYTFSGNTLSGSTTSSTPTPPTIYATADAANSGRGVGGAMVAEGGVNTANLVFYLGHGGVSGITFTYPNFMINYDANPAYALWNFGSGNEGIYYQDCSNSVSSSLFTAANPVWYQYYFSPASLSWGNKGPNDTLDWLALEACNVLQYNNDNLNDSSAPVYSSTNFYAWQRWGGAFHGLHMMLGYHTEGIAGKGAPGVFAASMLGTGSQTAPLTLVAAWFHAALTLGNLPGTAELDFKSGPVIPAAMGPVTSMLYYSVTGRVQLVGQFSDINDYYPVNGWPMGPSFIVPTAQTGWWYLHAEMSSPTIAPLP